MLTFLKMLPAIAALVLIPACSDLTPQQRTVVGVTGGAAAGLVAADVFGADKNWRVISALAGAAAGTLIASNSATGQCAYSTGSGGYYYAPCQ